MNSRAFNVYLMSDDPKLLYFDGKTVYPYTVDGKAERVWIDTVYYSNTDANDVDYVRKSLIEHDGYPEGIVVEEQSPLDAAEARRYYYR